MVPGLYAFTPDRRVLPCPTSDPGHGGLPTQKLFDGIGDEGGVGGEVNPYDIP